MLRPHLSCNKRIRHLHSHWRTKVQTSICLLLRSDTCFHDWANIFPGSWEVSQVASSNTVLSFRSGKSGPVLYDVLIELTVDNCMLLCVCSIKLSVYPVPSVCMAAVVPVVWTRDTLILSRTPVPQLAPPRLRHLMPRPRSSYPASALIAVARREPQKASGSIKPHEFRKMTTQPHTPTQHAQGSP